MRDALETIAHLRTWEPPRGLRFWLMFEPDRGQVVAVLVHRECEECKVDWLVDPTRPLDAAWEFLDYLAARVLESHCECEAIREVVDQVRPSPELDRLEAIGDELNRWADDRAGVPHPSRTDTRGRSR